MNDLALLLARWPDIVSDECRLAALAEYRILNTPPEQEFDDIVQLAAYICNAPVALVSLVTDDRQWFKAKIGFEPCETDLHSSVCAHALIEPDLLIVPDLTQDPRTADNPLVVFDPKIRFYAGAPLRTPRGDVIGSLCVIDGRPRPEGLMAEQAAMLRTLARQVMGLMELRRAVTSRDTVLNRHRQIGKRISDSTTQLKISEAHWRGLFERLSEGFIVGEVIRDEGGSVTDWRYVDVNAAWGELVGIDPKAAIGRTVRQVFPDIEDGWVDEYAQVVETGEAIVFTRQVGHLNRWYEGRAFALEADRFAVIFTEVTERVREDRRRDALLEMNDRLREANTIHDVIQTAASIAANAVGASRAGFAYLDADHEFVVVENDWVADGLASAAGRHNLADYGELRNDMLATLPLIINDVVTDPRTEAGSSRFLQLGTRALVNAPVVTHGRTMATFFVHAAEPREWDAATVAFLCNVADRLDLAMARVRATAVQNLLNQELSHRLKNTLAMVQAIATQTMKGVEDRGAVKTFSQRVRALSHAHDVLLQQSWAAAPIRMVMQSALGHLGQGAQFDLHGPDITLGPRATLSFSLLLHELTTNALKYGALSAEMGRIAVDWRIDETDAGHEMVLDWKEIGGPPAIVPERNGFGSRLIQSGLVGSGGVVLRYLDTGLEAEMRAPLDQVQES